ncbi:MAG: hypothetical protein PWQ35_619 [Patescibacteria group bacterium]|nr:hypothetical protein [Patescibacteria group bacterium]
MAKTTNNKLKVNKRLIWLSVSEAASLGGVNDKTIRRALKDLDTGPVFKIVKNRYQIELLSLIKYLHTNTKLKNKFNQFGLGQYIKEWKE